MQPKRRPDCWTISRAASSRREWAKRRTRRLVALEVRKQENAVASKAVGTAAKQVYASQVCESALALEAWSNDILKHYPVKSDDAEVLAPTLEIDPFTQAEDLTLILKPEAPRRTTRAPSPKLH